MRMLRHLSFAVLALTLVGGGAQARADTLLFDITGGFSSSNNLFGLGQGVVVTTTTVLDGIAFNLSTTSTTVPDVKYLIFDSTAGTLLYTSASTTLALSTTKSWVEIPVSFTLNAGSTYYIAYIGNAKVSSSIGGAGDVETGIAPVASGNSSYITYANPTFNGFGTQTVEVELFGTQDASATPEPGSMALLGTGLLGVVGTVRRRLRA